MRTKTGSEPNQLFARSGSKDKDPFSLEQPSGTVGTPEDILEEGNTSKCANLLPEDVRSALDSEEINNRRPQAGICRICGHRFSITHTKTGPFKFPLLQCDKAARMWDKAEKIRQDRLEKSRLKEAEILAKGRNKRQDPQWNG